MLRPLGEWIGLDGRGLVGLPTCRRACGAGTENLLHGSSFLLKGQRWPFAAQLVVLLCGFALRVHHRITREG